MKAKLLHRNGERTYVLVFDKGDAVIEELEGFARENELQVGVGGGAPARAAPGGGARFRLRLAPA